MCGSRYALAKRLHESEGNLSKMARGLRSVPPRLAARIAALAGADARTAALQAIIEGEQDAEKRAELGALFGIAPTPSEVSSSKV